jgi:hypothetical protein
MKKILFITLILIVANMFVVSKISVNSNRDLEINLLINKAVASGEGEYPNGLAGGTYECSLWQSACQCYVPGCQIWCIPEGYHCEAVACLYGPVC